METRPEALKKRFSATDRSRIAIEAGTHSAWVARLLESASARPSPLAPEMTI